MRLSADSTYDKTLAECTTRLSKLAVAPGPGGRGGGTSRRMERVPVTLPAWIVGDGAEPAPVVGDAVSYRVVFSPAEPHDLPEMCVHQRAMAETSARTDEGRYDVLLRFPTLTAESLAGQPADGEVAVGGRLFVDYEIFGSGPQGWLTGTVIDRRVIVEEALLPADPRALRQPYPITFELHEIPDGPFRFGLDPTPELGTVLRTQAELLLTIDLADA